MAYKLTPDLVRGLTAYLCKKHKAKIIDKGSATEMKIVARALALLKIQSKKSFLKNYATTLPACKLLGINKTRIYLPFKPGEAGKGVPSLKSQVEIICHEFQHSRQGYKNPLRFPLRYLTSKAKRAWYEARAMHCQLELCWFLRGRLPNLGQMAAKLYAYNCRKSDVQTVEKHLRIVAETVKRGGLYYRVAKDSITWLKKHKTRRARS